MPPRQTTSPGVDASSDAALIERLHAALDKASALAIEVARLSVELRQVSRDVAAALVDLIDRAEDNTP